MARFAGIALLPLLMAACVDLSRPRGGSVDEVDLGTGREAGPDLRRDGPAPAVYSDAGEDAPDDAPGVEDAPGDDAVLDPGDGPPAPPDLYVPDAPLSATGTPCLTPGQCASGFCTDGYCCDRACTGTCQACDRAGSAGSCGPVPAGSDPRNDCPQELPTTCGRDGTCDGAGACRRHAVGTLCGLGRCEGATEYAASTCNAAGACQAGASRSCAPNMCSGGSCASTCSNDGNCQTGFFCDGGACRARRNTGTACTAAAQCASNQCVDGFCCNTACNQLCRACNLAGSQGTCSPIGDGADPQGECPAEPSATCGRAGGCNGQGASRKHPGGTPCGSASCTGSTATAAATCNGLGGCTPGAQTSCERYLCAGAACGQTCASAAQCIADHKCAQATCLPNKITNLTVHDTARAGDWSVQANFQVGTGGARPWVEWPNTYIVSVDAPGNVLLGNEWIRLATESKKYTAGPQATLTLGAAADVYLIVDDRWPGSPPSWTAGWSNTGYNVTVFESSSRPALPFSVYRRTVAAGTVALPRIGDSTGYDYLVVVH
jgi:hypothetical protein